MTSIARRYHDLTAHSPDSVRAGGHTLDWDNKPFPFKVYTDIPGLHLPREVDVLATPALAAIAGEGAPPPARLTLAALTSLLYYSAGVTKRKAYPGGGEVLFRAAPSTGALYQTEAYVVAGDVEGLEPGVYHFCPGDFALRRLRDVDARGVLAEAAADATLAQRAATLVLSAIVWRNAWKYRARAYRHLFWDGGTLTANALAAATALGLRPRLVTGFVDAEIHRVLGIDGAREVAVALVTVGPDTPPAPPTPPLAPIEHPTLPLSRHEVDEPLVTEAHAASALASPDDVRRWRAGRPPAALPAAGRPIPLPAPDPHTGRALGETIQRRASTRRFGHQPVELAELGAALWAAARPVPADVPSGLVDIYISAHAVTGLPGGTYLYQRDGHALVPLDAGEFRRQAAFLTLEQPLGGDAAATFFFLAPLDGVLAAFGERGYRLVNLEAGLAGGRAYLAAYALGFGASGLTFYDAEVVRFFLPRAAGADAIFVTALGRAQAGGGGVLVSNPR
ncbi:MAG TPA: SagB/ThcOx family dehydrogenase [Methylomirabilota bacterium]|nr:SagB/ThcOx family dehydrogenase [Methylomirabilota bacterium]